MPNIHLRTSSIANQNTGGGNKKAGLSTSVGLKGFAKRYVRINGVYRALTDEYYGITTSILEFAPNGVTIRIKSGFLNDPRSAAGQTALFNGATYTIVDDTSIRNFTGDYSKIVTTRVTDMSGLFSTTKKGTLIFNGSDFNQDISSWDVSNVTNMSGMFGVSETNISNPEPHLERKESLNYIFALDLRRIDIAEVLAGEALRVTKTLHQDLPDSEFNKKRPDIAGLFNRVIELTGERKFNKDISKWDVSKVTNMSGMFAAATDFNQDIGQWDVSNVTDMTGMFFFARAFNQNISRWVVSKVTNMFGMFADATDFNRDVGKWDVSNVTNMSGMFMNATKFDRELGEWKVSKVTNMAGMFLNATAFNQDISSWDVFYVTNMAGMFFSATAFNQDISSWDVFNVTNMSGMLFDASTFNNGRPKDRVVNCNQDPDHPACRVLDGTRGLSPFLTVPVDGGITLLNSNFTDTNDRVGVYDEFATRTVMAAQYGGGNDKLVNDLFPPPQPSRQLHSRLVLMRFPHRLHLKELLDHYFLWGDKRSTAEVLAGEPGHVRVYKIAKNGGTVWEQVGEDIDGEDFSGNSVSLIHDGTNYVVAIGAYTFLYFFIFFYIYLY